MLEKGGLILKVLMKTVRSAGCFIFWETRPLTNKCLNKELRRGFLKYLVLKILLF